MPVNVNNVTRQNSPDNHGHHGHHEPCPVLLAPAVYPALVAGNGSSTTISGVNNTVVVQNLVNPALIAAYALVLPAMLPTDNAFVVVTSLGGITTLTVTGGTAIPSNALANPNSALVLTWNGSIWVIG
ncbi:hypothetical protein [Enterobacter asburiae]|uniref:hypothetical protein n=1 Tax=Enterobacter asburiae TaxID=61645 RepID=UPI00192A8F66|nr:hypothetical protein [Enterobacter asburiae]MBL5926789.1 hypothetical protein [Enterobacter asburiae]MBL5957576.1 hypothetical protein [Enterobacter asburiae]